MKIINLEQNGDGYSGLFTTDYRHYKRFNISATKHQVTALKTPPEVSNYDQFINIWERCGKSSDFFKVPPEVKELTLEALKEVEVCTKIKTLK